MGCGASKQKLSDLPDIDPIQVPHSEPGYPNPKPPTSRKKDIFLEDDYKTIDENVSKVKVLGEMTYEELIAVLTLGLTSDVERIRAIFYFVGSQNIEKQYYPGIKDPHVPWGYMKLIKLGKGNYESFFALLCRAAGFPCMILQGKGKSVGYEVGDEDVSKLHSSWNAVYIDGQWRIVHPMWAFTGVMGYDSGRWVKIEDKGQQTREKAKASKGTHVSKIDEFWFLPDPEEFIHFCIADKQEWQLLKEPWTVAKFVDVPHFRTPYFTKSDITLGSAHKATLVSDEGKVEIKFDHDEGSKSDLTYDLFFDENNSSGKLPEKDDLPRCVFFESMEHEKRLMYRFHVGGIYKTTLFLSRDGFRSAIVSFKIDCNEVAKNPNLFPINPPIGFGYGHVAKDFGLLSPSEKDGVVQTGRALEFEFRVDTKKELEARLRHNELKSEDLQQYIKQMNRDDHVMFSVSVPEHENNGEFALQIYAKEGGRLNNIVNYLLTDNKDDFTSDKDKKEREKERLKQQLKDAIDGDDPDVLENAIEEFEAANVEDDDGDLPIAKDKLEELRKTMRLRQRLKRAISGDDPDELQDAIDEFESSKIEDEDRDLPRAKKRLQQLIQERLGADEMRRLKDNLRRAMGSKDIEQLKAAVAECEEMGLDSDPEVMEASEMLVQLYEQALEDAMEARDVDEVQRLVNSAKSSPVSIEMNASEVMKRAEKFLRQQARLKRYLGVVLDLKPSTVSEIHRYPNPKNASYHSVVATYLILGEKMKVLQKWERVRHLLRQYGKKGIIRRIRNFDMEDLTESRAEKAKSFLDRYTLDDVRIVSAGAAAFYVWSSNIVKEELAPEEVEGRKGGKPYREDELDEGIGDSESG